MSSGSPSAAPTEDTGRPTSNNSFTVRHANRMSVDTSTRLGLSASTTPLMSSRYASNTRARTFQTPSPPMAAAPAGSLPPPMSLDDDAAPAPHEEEDEEGGASHSQVPTNRVASSVRPRASPALAPATAAVSPTPPQQQQQQQQPPPHEGEVNSSSNTSTTSLPVPLITPRYQRRSRTTRHMEITDSGNERMTPTEALRFGATETMTIRNGPMSYTQDVHFHTYEVYRHGKHQIHTRSVGYSSDGDLVMTREDYSSHSDADGAFHRRRTEITEPTVLEPRARRPLTEREARSKQRLHFNRPRYKKYPGIHAPRNHRRRNQLHNMFFTNEYARIALDAARARREEGIDDTAPPEVPSVFHNLPDSFHRAFALADEEQRAEFERLGLHRSPGEVQAPPRDPDSGEARFAALNTRLRGELQHALNSEFLTTQIADLDACFHAFVRQRGPASEESVVFRFRDGYGRLVCHGVAAYYQLQSESRVQEDGETKLTYVNLPSSKRVRARQVAPPHAPLLHVLCKNRANLPLRGYVSPQQSPSLGPNASPPLAGGLAGQDMPPLDIGVSTTTAAAMGLTLAPPPPLEGSAGEEGGDGNDDSDSDERDGSNEEGDVPILYENPTVCLTQGGELPVLGMEMPQYVPMCCIMEDGLVGTTPPLGPVGSSTPPPLTATQRKKLRKAEKEAAAQATLATGGVRGQ